MEDQALPYPGTLMKDEKQICLHFCFTLSPEFSFLVLKSTWAIVPSHFISFSGDLETTRCSVGYRWLTGRNRKPDCCEHGLTKPQMLRPAKWD